MLTDNCSIDKNKFYIKYYKSNYRAIFLFWFSYFTQNIILLIDILKIFITFFLIIFNFIHF